MKYIKLYLSLSLLILAGCNGNNIGVSPSADSISKVHNSTNLTVLLKTDYGSVAKDSTNNSRSPSIVLYFNKPVDLPQINSTNIGLYESTNNQIATTAMTVSSNQQAVVFSPQASLANNQSYYVKIAGGIKATDGSTLGSDYIAAFKTGTAEAPTTALVIPYEKYISRQPNIQVVFSNENMLNLNTTYISLRKGSTQGAAISSNLTCSKEYKFCTLTPKTLLQPEQDYYVYITQGITNSQGIKLLQNYGFKLSTGKDIVPTASLITPVNNATNVPTSSKLELQFNEPVNNIEGHIKLYQITASQTELASTLAISSDRTHVSISPSSYLPLSSQIGIVIESSIQDDYGTRINIQTFSFKTESISWTWLNGKSIVNQKSFADKIGSFSFNNAPGARDCAAIWLQETGALWLFGGSGYDSNGTKGSLNDLWKYDLNLKQWMWVSGSILANQAGNYGTKGVPVETNMPGGRFGVGKWLDRTGNLWLFGGYHCNINLLQCQSYYNDLWKYDPKTNRWVWLNGTNKINQPGIYGIKGVMANQNTPGSRNEPQTWLDESGNMWLFGGYGYDSMGNYGWLNDLWKYSPAANQWTWLGGGNKTDEAGLYGMQWIANPSNMPGGRYGAATWKDSQGNFWLFGGKGYDAAGSLGFLNDLWKYQPNTNEWTWYGGSSVINQSGVYGEIAISSPFNMPSARYAAGSWSDKAGNLWLFGGEGFDINGDFNYLNDVWKLDLTSNTWTWVAGKNIVNQIGSYGTLGSPSSTITPGSRSWSSAAGDSQGNLWLFGGFGLDSSGNTGKLNDLWHYGYN